MFNFWEQISDLVFKYELSNTNARGMYEMNFENVKHACTTYTSSHYIVRLCVNKRHHCYVNAYIFINRYDLHISVLFLLICTRQIYNNIITFTIRVCFILSFLLHTFVLIVLQYTKLSKTLSWEWKRTYAILK